jgi:hypothetical protein
MFAAMLIPELCSDMMTVAAVVNFDTPHIAVVCRQLNNPNAADEWEALYAIVNGQVRHLPSCFALREDAKDALDDLTQEETA